MKASHRLKSSHPWARIWTAVHWMQEDSTVTMIVLGCGHTVTLRCPGCDRAVRVCDAPSTTAVRAHLRDRQARCRRRRAMSPGDMQLAGDPGSSPVPKYFVYCERCRWLEPRANVPSACRRCHTRPRQVKARVRCDICDWEGWFIECPECSDSTVARPHHIRVVEIGELDG
jgi:hypothetical protein